MNTVDLLIKNANVYTMEADRNASVVGIKNSKIVYVGDDESQVSVDSENTRVIDAAGRVVLPGLIDAHAHTLSLAALEGIELDISMDLNTVLAVIKEYVDEHPEKDSYFGQVYLETCIGKENYVKETLDAVCPDKPLMLLGSTCHEEWVNSKALEAAGITKDTKDPVPGEQYFERDSEGNPTGKIVDLAPFEMIVNACNPCDNELMEAGIAKYLREYNSLGITGIAEAGILSPADEKSVLDTLDLLREKGEVTCRIAGSTIYSGINPLPETIDHLKSLNSRYDDDIIRFRTIKMLQDGCYEARTSSCYEEYLDTETNRPPTFYGDEIKSIFIDAAREGFDIHIHALGDRSIFEALDAARKVREHGFDRNRITIAHCHSIRHDDLKLFPENNVVANFTPQWFVIKEDIIKAIGQERHDDMFKMRSLDEMGTVITIGSDCPSDELGYEPWKGMEMAVTRQTYGCPDEEALQDVDERIDVYTAIKACTINGAYQMGLEDKVGSIKEGKYADLIMLDRNIFETEVHEIHKIRPVLTIFNGKVVYQRECDLKGEANENI